MCHSYHSWWTWFLMGTSQPVLVSTHPMFRKIILACWHLQGAGDSELNASHFPIPKNGPSKHLNIVIVYHFSYFFRIWLAFDHLSLERSWVLTLSSSGSCPVPPSCEAWQFILFSLVTWKIQTNLDFTKNADLPKQLITMTKFRKLTDLKTSSWFHHQHDLIPEIAV